MNIYLVRHGETEGNVTGTLMGGRLDFPLTEKGVLQAKDCGSSLEGIKFDKVFCSKNQRAIDTFELLNVFSDEVEFMDVLKEQDYGSITGERLVDIPKEIDDLFFADPYNFKHEGGESFNELINRVSIFLDQLVDCDFENILVITHANVIKAIVANIYGMRKEAMSLNVKNCSVSLYKYSDLKFECEFFNEIK